MIYKSEQIHELAMALSSFQGEMQDVYKSSKGYGYDYADLSAVFESVRPLLKRHGLAVTQPVGGSNNMIELNTILMHSSGQYISSIISIPVDLTNKKMNSLQAAGSTITYLRRYCVCSILGLTTTDDDGKAGGESMDKEVSQRSYVCAPIPAKSNIAQIKEDIISEVQLQELREQLMIRLMDEEIPSVVVADWCHKAKVKSIQEFNHSQTMRCLKYLNQRTDNFTQPAETMDEIVSRLSDNN